MEHWLLATYYIVEEYIKWETLYGGFNTFLRSGFYCVSSWCYDKHVLTLKYNASTYTVCSGLILTKIVKKIFILNYFLTNLNFLIYH